MLVMVLENAFFFLPKNLTCACLCCIYKMRTTLTGAAAECSIRRKKIEKMIKHTSISTKQTIITVSISKRNWIKPIFIPRLHMDPLFVFVFMFLYDCLSICLSVSVSLSLPVCVYFDVNWFWVAIYLYLLTPRP